MTKKLQNPESVKIIPSSNAKRVVERLGRLSLTGIFAFTIGGLTTFDRYNNYWDKTIFRVQTVDFNILSYTLPTKLSYAITQNKPEEVQRTLDSNYTLFGLIVTDSSGQKIIAFSGKDSNRPPSWKAALNPQELKNHPYDLLLDPPPVYPQWTYSSSHAIERTATNLTNRGRVIGRVYYVRGVRPIFQDDFLTWLSNPLSESSRIQTYTMTLLACVTGSLAFWILWEYILYKKRVAIDKAQEREQASKDNNKVLEVLLAERINELTLLRNQREQEESLLTRDTNNLDIGNQILIQEICQLKESLTNLSKNTDSIPLETELEKARLEAEQNLNKQKKYQQHIEKLSQDLRLVQNIQQEATELQESELAQLQQQIEDIKNSRSLVESELNQLRNSEKNSQRIVTILEKQLATERLLQEELNSKLKILERSLFESQQREEELKKRAKQAQAESEALAKEIRHYTEDRGRHPLNDFEISILNSLKQHFSDKEVFTQFDVGTGQQGTRFTDFIIVMNNCCIVIEAKSYTGIIESVGFARNTGWTCRNGARTTNINACWGRNPYEQVKTYCDCLYGRIHSQWSNLPVYAVVVFPGNSDIDNNIESNISGYYRVTTLNHLVTVIEQLENQARFQNRTRLTYRQILQKLTGISNQQVA
ncbi:MAG: NERD domain-containing protein [Nostoc sp.]|uniref:NERD domain-containing protein n=1 Tax=Nostoc sp. TaxID=1180 RepID=UPI002FF8FDF4